MSETNPQPPTEPTKPAGPKFLAIDSLKGPQFVISLIALGSVDAVFAFALYRGDPDIQKNIVIACIGVLNWVMGFWVGSARSSQAKDERAAAAP